jgi:uncharacterized protein GlcG (DUF336 family)
MLGITYAQARVITDAALARAEEMNCPISVAVIDAGRELVTFGRQAGAPLASAEIAQAKAFTSRSLDVATVDLAVVTQPGGPLFGLETACGRPLVTFGGGRPLFSDGIVIGAIGVSGGTVEQDDEIALCAANVLDRN